MGIQQVAGKVQTAARSEHMSSDGALNEHFLVASVHRHTPDWGAGSPQAAVIQPAAIWRKCHVEAAVPGHAGGLASLRGNPPDFAIARSEGAVVDPFAIGRPNRLLIL